MIEEILSGLIASGITNGFGYRTQLFNRFKYNLLFPNKSIRLTLSCLLKLENDGKFLIIRNLNRPENFAPIGGVIKYQSSASSFLKGIEWNDEVPYDNNQKSKIDRDLRGYIPAKNLFKFLEWFLEKMDREENSLYREIIEELTEIGLGSVLDKMGVPDFKFIRTVSEGPSKVIGKTHHEFRLFSVYEFSNDLINDNKDVLELLINQSKTLSNLLFVSSEEILQGRAKTRETIGSNTPYLISNTKSRLKDRPWSQRK